MLQLTGSQRVRHDRATSLSFSVRPVLRYEVDLPNQKKHVTGSPGSTVSLRLLSCSKAGAVPRAHEERLGDSAGSQRPSRSMYAASNAAAAAALHFAIILPRPLSISFCL